MQIEKELMRLPGINNELMQMIELYEANFGDFLMDGERFYNELKEEEVIIPRNVTFEELCTR